MFNVKRPLARWWGKDRTENLDVEKRLAAPLRREAEWLARETATAEILRLISSFPTDPQPVFDAIARSAVGLCGGLFSVVLRFDGEWLRLAAHHDSSPAAPPAYRAWFPRRAVDDDLAGPAVLERRVVNVGNVTTVCRLAGGPEVNGFRSAVFVPMLRKQVSVGAVGVCRLEIGPFPDDVLRLLTVLADQAAVAIENARRFAQLQQQEAELAQAHVRVCEVLEQQTATSEVLRIISQSTTDIEPILDAVAEHAARVCGADDALILRIDGERLRRVAHYGGISSRALGEPYLFNRKTVAGRAILDRRTLHIDDVVAILDTEFPESRDRVTADGSRTMVATPLLREGIAIGAILIRRTEVRPFSDKHIALLQIFADQAVIAIENGRLFNDLQARTQQLARSVEESKALAEVGQAISSTLDLHTVLRTIVARATQLSYTDAGVIYEYDLAREVFVPRATHQLENEIVHTMLAYPVRKGEGVTGRLAQAREPISFPDIRETPLGPMTTAQGQVGHALLRAGYRGLLAVPLVREDRLLGSLTVYRKKAGDFAPEVIDMLRTFATQSGLAIQNARLFMEIEDKSRQLEVASQHKSEFLANMSHELRTPLNAILGFSEVLAAGMFGEVNAKQAEYLNDILASGRHLLALINDILDLSKIEAGRMELEPTDVDLPSAIDDALTLVRERAGRRGIAFGRHIDDRVGMIRGDERKVKQVVLNLLSNAVKFTPEGGRIDVRAALMKGTVEVSVTDTGIGISPEDQALLFEEFRQVGTADKKVEGTGLGLALSRKFVELHGGRIWVESALGHGSTFTFTLPVHSAAARNHSPAP